MTVRRGDKTDIQGFDDARSGTAYWTLSLYIEAERVAETLGLDPGKRAEPALFRQFQRRHMPSLALANAIDPLMNDIADRETQGEVQELLLAAIDSDGPFKDLDEAADAVRDYETLVFKMPDSVSWTTEGVRFEAYPPNLNHDRVVRLRRFWLSHNNGALSYHLSFSHFYGAYRGAGGETVSGYDPSTFYFLSMMQKLAAPKEYALDPAVLTAISETEDPFIDVFRDAPLDIDPLDAIRIEHPRRAAGTETETVESRFWPFVRATFDADAARLFNGLSRGSRPPESAGRYADRLIELVPFVEVPGLKVPKSRVMFMLHDEAFFDRLMPMDEAKAQAVSRKARVQDGRFDPYQDEIKKLTKPVSGLAPRSVRLGRPEVDAGPPQPGDDYWTWVAETGQPDCLDYLFLAGFNQNIIDFMNQDTSEILDSIDPIYPDSDEQSDERFFVRYANHRAMITYVPKSRSLEIGNDYIGGCPYAFLIHALALHNEFLARDHEAMTMARIDRIDAVLGGKDPRSTEAMQALYRREPLEGEDKFEQAEIAINRAKLAKFDEYERFRHANPFRYDTERDVFEKLEQLRGISRKTEALSLAVASLEDHARDLHHQQQKKIDKDQKARDETAARRAELLSIALGMTGVFGAGQMFYWIGEKAAGTEGANAEAPRGLMTPFGPLAPGKAVGDVILATTEVLMISALAAFAVLLGLVLYRWCVSLGRQK